MSAIMAVQTFIRMSYVACQGDDAIKSITVTPAFAKRLDHEASQMDMQVHHSASRTNRKIMGIDILVSKP